MNRLRLWLARKILPRGWYIGSCGPLRREFHEAYDRAMREPPKPGETYGPFLGDKPEPRILPRGPMHPPQIQEFRT